MFENLTKSMSHIVCLIWKFSRGGWRTAFLASNRKWRTKCYRLYSSIINAQFKAFWIPILQYNKSNQNRNLEAKNRESNWTVIITINQEFTLLEVTENMLKSALNLCYVCLQTYCLFFIIIFFSQKLIYLFYFFWVSHLIRVWEQQQKWHLLM